MSKATELRDAAAAKFKAAHDLVQGKDVGDLTAEIETQFDALMAEATAADAAFQKAASADARMGSLKERLDFYHGKATGGAPIPWQKITLEPPAPGKSLGQQFVDSAEYKELKESGALESDNARFKSAPFRGEKAATDVIVPSGGRMQIGGSTGSLHAMTRQILGYLAQQSSEETALTVTATILP